MKKNHNLTQQNESIDFAKYFRLLKRKKWTILTIFGVVFLVWMLGAIKLGPRPTYQTSALLQFEDRRALSALDARGRPEYEGKIGILMSRNFLTKVVEKKSMAVVFPGVDRIAVADSVYLKNDYVQGSYLLKKTGDNLQLFFTDPSEIIQNKKVLDMPYPDNNLIEYNGIGIVLNPQFWTNHTEVHYKAISKEKAVEALRKTLFPTFRNRARTVLSVGITGEDRFFIAEVLNTLVDEFVQQNLDFKKFHMREILNILTEQLKTAKKDLDSAVKDLKEFREENPWVGLTADATGIVTGVSSYEVEKSALENRKSELELLLSRYNSSSGEARYPILNEVLSFLGSQGVSTIPALASEFTTLTAERTRLLASYAPSHQFVLDNQQKLNELEKKVLLTANNQLGQYNSQLSSIRQKIRENTFKIKKLPAKELQLAELQRRRSVADQVYSALLVRHNQAKIADAVEVGDLIILDRAVVPPPIGRLMTYLKYALIGLALGLGLAIGFVLIMDLLDKTVRTSDELERILPMRVIAKIPIIQSEKEIMDSNFSDPVRIDPKLVTADYSPTPVGEAYRSLRTQMLFNDRKIRSIFISSLNPNEGKSLNAGNLAITFAQQKLPTLLVDADLRRGVLHNSFACKKKPGLSDFLYSNADITDENIRKIIQQTHIPNLYLLSSGMPIPNPSEVLGSQRGQEVFDFLKKRFGMLVVDTPPVMVTSDSIIVSRYVDTGLFVIRAGKSNVDQIKVKLTEYQDYSKRLAGVLLNFAREDIKKDTYKYSYYNY